jgi:hypothetical protein
LKFSSAGGNIQKQERIGVEIDWLKVPSGESPATFSISSTTGEEVRVGVKALNPDQQTRAGVKGYVESNGCISMEAAGFSRKTDHRGVFWREIPGLGKTVSGMTTFPVNRAGTLPVPGGACLEYDIHLFTAGTIQVIAYLSPTLNFNDAGLRYAVSIDGGEPQIIDIHREYTNRDWERWVSNNVIHSSSSHEIKKSGNHVLEFWSVDPGVVLQKIVVDTGGLKPSYLGPPQSYMKR